MIKKTVAYVNFNDELVNRDLYFNLTSIELAELEGEENLSTAISEALDKEDNITLLKILNKIILKSYGEISNDGESFIKSKEVIEKFKFSKAYDTLINNLLFGDDKEALPKFIEHIIPKDISEKMEKK